MMQGLWVIMGLLAFLLLEKMFPDQDSQEDTTSESDLNSNCAVSTYTKNGCLCVSFYFAAVLFSFTAPSS